MGQSLENYAGGFVLVLKYQEHDKVRCSRILSLSNWRATITEQDKEIMKSSKKALLGKK